MAVALVMAVLFGMVFWAGAQAETTSAAERQTATATPTPTSTPAATPTPTPTPTSAVATVEEVLEKGLRLAEASPVHLAVRGTGVNNSARCDWQGVARTAAQREQAVRFWLELAAADPLPTV